MQVISGKDVGRFLAAVEEGANTAACRWFCRFCRRDVFRSPGVYRSSVCQRKGLLIRREAAICLGCLFLRLSFRCEDDQTSADLAGHEDRAPGGAMTTAFISVLTARPFGHSYPSLMQVWAGRSIRHGELFLSCRCIPSVTGLQPRLALPSNCSRDGVVRYSLGLGWDYSHQVRSLRFLCSSEQVWLGC